MNISTMKATTKPVSKVASMDVRKIRQMLRAYDHPIRRWMLDLIHENEELTVTDIYTRWYDPKTGRRTMEQSVCSQHLKILRKAELVKSQQDGKYRYYSINSHTLRKIKCMVECV